MAEVLIGNIENLVVDAITGWARANVAEVVLFDRQMKALRKSQDKKSGMSKAGSLQRLGEIPISLNEVMKRRFGMLWRENQKLKTLFWKHFRVGRIDRDHFVGLVRGSGNAWRD